MTSDEVDRALFPNGRARRRDRETLLDLYKMMVKSSEELVARRQSVNTFFVTINGAILAGMGVLVTSDVEETLLQFGILLLAIAGSVLSLAWRSRIISFGQLNTGKFAVISRLEKLLPAAIYDAEWVALGKGKDPSKYKTFTSREIWPPMTFMALYLIATISVLALLAAPYWPVLIEGWASYVSPGVPPLPSPTG